MNDVVVEIDNTRATQVDVSSESSVDIIIQPAGPGGEKTIEYAALADLDLITGAEVGWYTGPTLPVFGSDLGPGKYQVVTQIANPTVGIVLQHIVMMHPAISGVFSRYGLLQAGAPTMWLSAFAASRPLPSFDNTPESTQLLPVGYRTGTTTSVSWSAVDYAGLTAVTRGSSLRNISGQLVLATTAVGTAVATGIRDAGRVTINLGKRTWTGTGALLSLPREGYNNGFLPEFGAAATSTTARVRYYNGYNDDGTVGSRFKLYDNGLNIRLDALTPGTNQNLIFDWPVSREASSSVWPGTPA